MSDDINERERFDAEQKLKQAELALKERETALKEIESQRSSGFLGRLGPVGVGIFVAGIGLIGSLITTALQGIYQRELERTKSERTLIVELAKAGDLERAQKNMQFFVRAGLISDRDGKLAAALENKENVPFLPTPSERLLQPAAAHVEASIIDKVPCSGSGENKQKVYWIYQYTARPPGNPTFRVVNPSDWSQLSRDLYTRREAEVVWLQACSDCPIDPGEDAEAAKVRMDAAQARITQNSADTASQKDYMCHKRLLESVQPPHRAEQ